MRGVRHALRSLVRTPLFTATALLILSLSVGATTAIFSMLHALVLRPIDAPRPHELVQLTTFNHRGQNTDLTWRQYREVQARQQVFKSLFASIQQGVFTVETGRSTVRASIAGVSGSYFREFGARPALGRLIEPSDLNEAAVTAEPVVLISWTFWQREFGGAPDVIGRTITADLVPLTIVGVTPRDFLGLSIAIEHDITVPIPLIPKISQSEASMIDGTSSWVAVTGRLRDDVTLPEARAQLLALWPGILADAAPQQFLTSQRDEYLKRTLSVDSGATGWERGLRMRYTRALYVLQGIAAIVLLIAGANLCSLIFTRADARRHELGVRLALGSSRRRLIGEQTLEGVILGVGGAAGGLALATVASNSLAAFLLRDYGVPTAFDASPDRLVVAVAAAFGIGTAVAVTAAAGWLATRRPVALTSGSRTVARTSVVGRVLVGAQVALSIVLLSHASLLTRSVTAMVSEDSGLTKRNLLIAFPTERVGKYRDLDPAVYYPQALESVRAVAGVEAAAFITSKPHGGATPFEPTGRAGTPVGDTDLTAEQAQVSPGFFDTVEIPLLRGRDFTIADTGAAMKVAILSETLERRLFGEGRGLGERIRISRRPEWQDALVVGIARDARVFDVRGGNLAIAYTPAVQSGALAHYKFLVARAGGHASAEVQRAVDDIGVEYIRRFQTLDYARGRTILQERILAGLSAFFGALALLLVSVGLYGLLSYALTSRRKEFGIRLALGANPAAVAMQIVFSASVITAIGVAAGLVMTFVTTPMTRSVLVNVSPYDPMAIGVASTILLVCGGLAAAAPAWRAAKVQPIAELRQD
jgi:putative ABC transport system permease protein